MLPVVVFNHLGATASGTNSGKSEWLSGKLDRVGPVDNRPSTDYLHHFVKKRSDM